VIKGEASTKRYRLNDVGARHYPGVDHHFGVGADLANYGG